MCTMIGCGGENGVNKKAPLGTNPVGKGVGKPVLRLCAWESCLVVWARRDVLPPSMPEANERTVLVSHQL